MTLRRFFRKLRLQKGDVLLVNASKFVIMPYHAILKFEVVRELETVEL